MGWLIFFFNFDWRPNIQDLLPNSRDIKSPELCSVVLKVKTKYRIKNEMIINCGERKENKAEGGTPNLPCQLSRGLWSRRYWEEHGVGDFLGEGSMLFRV